jgi:hypothetical protein
MTTIFASPFSPYDWLSLGTFPGKPKGSRPSDDIVLALLSLS